jgi:hypothetical protein
MLRMLTGRRLTLAQSCMKCALDFLSAQGVLQVIKQSERLRKLPNSHPAKEDRLQARAMLVYTALNAAKLLYPMEPVLPT